MKIRLEKICFWKQLAKLDPLKEFGDSIERMNRKRDCYSCDGKDLSCKAYNRIWVEKK